MSDDSDLDARRRHLSERLSSLRESDESLGGDSGSSADESADGSRRRGLGFALSLSSSFVAAILVGAVLGYLVDSFLGSSPFGMFILLLLGFCAGILNIMRSAGLVSRSPLNFRDAGGGDDLDSANKTGDKVD